MDRRPGHGGEAPPHPWRQGGRWQKAMGAEGFPVQASAPDRRGERE